jgi:trans-aconitate 2-methyltransferase
VTDALRRLGQEEPYPWLFATPADTVRRLHDAGFVDADAWLHEEPTAFDNPDDLRTFLATVVLRSHLDRLAEADHDAFLDAVIELLPAPALDYVRLTMVATRA